MSISSKIKRRIKTLRKTEKVPIVNYVDKEHLLSGKIALITGGSSGIGKAIAQAFLNSGCKVIIAGSNEDKLEKAIKELCVKGEVTEEVLRPLIMDISNIEAIPEKIDMALSAFGEDRIDILVNSAGIHNTEKFSEVSEKEFDHIMDVNVKGTYFVTQYVANSMIQRKIKGHILNLASSSSLRPAWGPYQISKWAIRGMTLGFAERLQPYGIVVNAIAPGQTATPMFDKKDNSDITNDKVISGRYLHPDEIANLSVMLVSEMGDMVIGDTLYVTGGSGVISLQK